MASFGIITQLCTTIQGEGPTAGKSCLLIRVGNCILNCSYCDTKWTNNLKPLAVPRLTSTTDSLPFKIDTVSSMNIFIDLVFHQDVDKRRQRKARQDVRKTGYKGPGFHLL